MSVAQSTAVPEAPTGHADSLSGSRVAFLFVVILVTSVSALALSVVSYLDPIGDGDALPDYAAISSMRTYVWAFFIVAGVQLIVGVTATALAGLILVPARGSRWATTGAGLIWLGAALYGVGIGGWATTYWFATDSSTLGAATASRLVDSIGDDTWHMLVIPIGGAAAVGIGGLILFVGLWRAGTVPRWVILLGGASSIATFALPPSAIPGMAAEAVSSATTVAIGWYAWRLVSPGRRTFRMEDTMKGKSVPTPTVAVIALALLLIGVVVSEAQATAPGSNGKIAFRRYLDDAHTWGAVFVSESDGSGARQITRPSRGVVDDFPDWSADGKLLVFQRCSNSCAVYVVKPDGTGLRDLSPADGGATDESLATFLPDGHHIVFTRASGGVRSFPGGDQVNHSDLVVMNLEGGARRVIARAAPYKADFENAMFAPSGSRFVYQHRRSHFADPSTRQALVVASANGKTRHRITPWNLNAGDGADWSPDGTRILFRSYDDKDDATQSQLFQIHPDGTHMKQLTHLPDGTLLLSSGYSPDGKWIVYATAGKGGAADVRVMQVDGSHDAPVTRTTAWDSAPDWGPR